MEITRRNSIEKLNHYIDYIDFLMESEQYLIALKNINNLKKKNFNTYFKKGLCYYYLNDFDNSIEQFTKCNKICNQTKNEYFIELSKIKKNNNDLNLEELENKILNTNKTKISLNEDLISCPLTLEKFQNPYMTSYGNTYEYAALIEHLKNVGKFDPLTREYLDENMIFPNRKLKELLDFY